MDALEEILIEFRTEEDAARQGLIKALRAHAADKDPDFEHGGIVFQDPKTGLYYLANGGPMRGETKDHIQIRGTRRAKGDKLAAAYHTHPPQDKRGVFSGDDTSSAAQTKIPMYLGLAHDQTARVYDSRVDKIRQSRASVKTDQTTPGRPFMPGMRMVPEDPAVLDADKRAQYLARALRK